jgi:hypothetical protein
VPLLCRQQSNKASENMKDIKIKAINPNNQSKRTPQSRSTTDKERNPNRPLKE